MKRRGISMSVWSLTGLGVLCWALPSFGVDQHQRAKLMSLDKAGCPDATITIDIMTDSYGSETSWEVVEQGTGTVMGSGGPYGNSTLYTETVCVDSTSCYDFIIYDTYGDGIYAPGGYTVSYNGVVVADTMGSGWDGYSEMVENIGGGCVFPTGACCVDGSCDATNTEAECDAMGGAWYEGEECPAYQCPSLLLDCPVGSLLAQPLHFPADPWTLGVSDTSFPYIRYENIPVDVVGDVCDVHWWGGELDADLGNCTRNPNTYEIKFYADAGGVPGAQICAYTVTPNRVNTGLLYHPTYQVILYEYSVDLVPCCTINDGWVSIQGVGDPVCRFWWDSSGTGDASHCGDDGTGLVCGGDNDFDLSICLTGEYVPQFGACCDDDTGICVDDVEIIDCPTRFAADTLCADLDPPCGEIPGACCVGTVCSEVTAGACAGMGGEFLGQGTVCLPDICGCEDATITIEIMTDDYPSETTWDLVEQGVGVVASGGPLADPNTLHTEVVCVSSTSCYDFTIYDLYGDGICCGYGDGYYNVYYNGGLVGSGGEFGDSETVSFIGDGCVDPTGACCVDGVCVGTMYEEDCTGDWYIFEDCADFICPQPIVECPTVNLLFGQTPFGPDDAWSFGTSEADVDGSSYIRYESYSVLGNICDIHWWGIFGWFDGVGWSGCTESDPSFSIKFYADAGGMPGAEVASYTVTPTVVPTGIVYGDLFEMMYFSVDTLSPCVTEFNGWVSIQGFGDIDCWFLWAGSPDGDLSNCFDDGTGIVCGPPDHDYDLAVCLTGEYIPQFGACCDDNTGTCDENVEIIDCTTRFAADTLCADLDPPCGAVPGACCYPDGSCMDQVPADCTGVFEGPGTNCATTVCPSPGDDCTNPMTVTLGVADLPYVNNNTNCGRGDVYDDSSTDHCLYYYDSGEDMIYEITVTEEMFVRVHLDPHGTTYPGVAIGDACPPTDSCLASDYHSSSEPLDTGCVLLAPGTYYVQVDTWSSPDCIPDFTLTIAECPEGGACCHPDETCTDVLSEGDCPDLYMGNGTTCATVTCPAGNDVCQTAEGIDPVPAVVNGDLTGAGTENPPACGDNPEGRPAQDLWYTVTGTGNYMQATTCGGASFDTRISVFSGDCSALDCEGGDDDDPCARSRTTLGENTLAFIPRGFQPVAVSSPVALAAGDMKRTALAADKKAIRDPEALQSKVQWCSEAGVTYYISIGTYSTSTTPGPFTMTVEDIGDCTYCPGSGGCDEYISNVTVGSINNDSDCEGYGDFTALSTDMAIGASYEIIVTNGYPYSSDTAALWIDWNQDLDFDDADETIIDTWVGNGPYVTTITPPAGALLGETRMRVRLQYGGVPLPCGTTSYGEVEDYTVRVVPAVGACCQDPGCDDTEEGDCPGDWLGVGTACDGDCQPDGDADICDLYYGTSLDCNDNDVPDECELTGNDCNSNGVPDDCELVDNDCNNNSVPDECDVPPIGTGPDCQGDGIPDECQLTGGAPRDVVIDESFEGAFPPADWENIAYDLNGPWIVSTNLDYVHTGAQSAVHPWSTPDNADSYLLTPELTITSGTVSVWSIGCFEQGWCDWYDIDVVIVIGDPGGGDDVFVGNLNDLWTDYFTTWQEGVFDLNPPSTPFRVGFRYYGLDGDLGVIDDVVIEGSTGPPANDCNENGVPDECDVPPIGTGPDCQPDGVPDECQLEGNDDIPPGGDGVPDECNGCGDGWVDPSSEECEGGDCCTDECLFDTGTVCRPEAGACDAAEACDGTSADCPADEYVSEGVGCRPAAGVCDVGELCDGMSPDCPTDEFVEAGTECRESTGGCDPAEACTGTGAACPADVVITECIDDDGCCPEGCDFDTDNDCFSGIPTMSQWGLAVLALLLAVLAKIYFGHRRRVTA